MVARHAESVVCGKYEFSFVMDETCMDVYGSHKDKFPQDRNIQDKLIAGEYNSRKYFLFI